ncbi:MAG: NeuD/PglB/VioB family sugar acetyltransferase [Phycisphaerales bacterium]|nr:NeuD/PglB/VioB family sugar acetyltransferase [Phycisphaerales bacterium]
MAAAPLILIGAGGHALVVAEACRAVNRPILGVLDDRADSPAITRLGLAHLGGLRDVPPSSAWILCVGNVHTRAELIAGLKAPSTAEPVVHPSAVIAPSATLGVGVFVGPRAVVHSFAKVEAHAIINTGAIIEHDCVVGRNTHVAPGSIVAGSASIGSDGLLGVGCRVLPRVRVGDRCTVGAGSVVLRDLPNDSRIVGVPARHIDSR